MIEIIYQHDQLNREVWQFQFIDHHRKPVLILEEYHQQNRSSTRHKWISTEFWQRIGHRRSTLNNVPLPAEVIAEAKVRFMELIEVKVCL